MKGSLGLEGLLRAFHFLAVCSMVPLSLSIAHAATTERVSVSSTGEQGNDNSWGPAISADGRFVAFVSAASVLVPGDTNAPPGEPFTGSDVFVRDRLAGITERVNVSSTGEQANGPSNFACISADGRFVAFDSLASNLVPGDTNGKRDVFVRDRLAETTERVSVSSTGQQGNAQSQEYWGDRPAISADGRLVAFDSSATNLVAGDTNNELDVFVRDRSVGTTERVSVNSDGTQRNYRSRSPVMSGDGRYVAFESYAIFVRDRVAGTTEQVDVTTTGQPAEGISGAPGMNATGRFVGFEHIGQGLVPVSVGGTQVYLRDLAAQTTELVSVSTSGEPMEWGPGSSCCGMGPAISADGRFVAFDVPPEVSNMVPGDVNEAADICVRDRANGTTDLVSASSEGLLGNGHSWGPSISADGRFVAFASDARNLVLADTNDKMDIFLADLGVPSPAHLSIVINAGALCASSHQVTLGLQFPDGCVQMRLRNAPYDWAAWEPCAPEKAWTLSVGDGAKTVCMQCRDAQGNVSQEVCDDILVDTIPPQNVSIIINAGADCFAPTVRQPGLLLALSAADARFMRFSNDGQNWSEWELFNNTKRWPLPQSRGLVSVWFQCADWCSTLCPPVSDDIWRALFDDVTCRHSQRPHIEALVKRGIAAGCSANPPLYCPEDPVTREQMAKFLCLAAGKQPLNRETPTFCDVPKTHPFYSWIERLADAASWNGNPPTTGCAASPCRKYCPSNPVLRDEMAAFLVRATGRSPTASCPGLFADVWPGGWACPYIERLADPGSWPGGIAVTNGCACPSEYPPGAKCYCPKSNVTRGQMAVFLVRAFGITP
jgi:hypothetical protein